MKTRISICSFLLLPILLFSGDMGKAGYTLWQMDLGGKPAAMAGAFVASSADLNGLPYNPASIAGLDSREVLFTAVDDLLDIKTGYLAYTQQVQGNKQLGVICHYKNYGSIQETDIVGDVIGTSTPSDFSISTSLAKSWSEHIDIGVSLKFIQSSLAQYTSYAFGTDVGVLYHIPKQQLNLGLAVNNLGYSFKAYDKDNVPLPLTYRVGFSKQLAHLPLQVHCNLNRYHFDKSELAGGFFWAIGGEFTLSEQFFLRLGYHSKGKEQKLGSTQDRAAGVSFGMGLVLKSYRIDLSSSSNGVVGRINQFTIAIVL